MKQWMALGAMVLVVGAAAPTARAQDDNTTSMMAGGVSLLGQSAGGALAGGDSILVTDTGRAHIPASVNAAYAVSVIGEADTAVGAAAIRDAKLAKLQGAAQRFGAHIEITTTGFSLETDAKARAERQGRWMAEQTQHPGGGFVPMRTDDLPQAFIAQANVRLGSPANSQDAAFLDALKAAGAGDITDLLNAPKPANVFFPQMFGAGQIADIDDAVWNSAGVDAIHRAREQAATLAAAAGRGLGDVTQITFLTKTVKGGDANVIVAVRFALVAGKAQ